MSKARLVLTVVAVEGCSQSEVARAYGVSQPWISRLSWPAIARLTDNRQATAYELAQPFVAPDDGHEQPSA